MFENDPWFQHSPCCWEPSPLDWFDPFDELDLLSKQHHKICWLHQPKLTPCRHTDTAANHDCAPLVSNKYRITVDVHGYDPKSIKAELKDNKLLVSAREEHNKPGDNYLLREFRKTVELPSNVVHEKMVSFVTPAGWLVVETPLTKDSTAQSYTNSVINEDLYPKIGENGKSITMSFVLPSHIDPSKVNITCKEGDIVIKAEDKVEKGHSYSSCSFYKRTTLPKNINYDSIKAFYENNTIKLTASFL